MLILVRYGRVAEKLMRAGRGDDAKRRATTSRSSRVHVARYPAVDDCCRPRRRVTIFGSRVPKNNGTNKEKKPTPFWPS